MHTIPFHDAGAVLDVLTKGLTFATAFIAAWQAYRGNQTAKQNARKLDDVHREVNGRMSEVVAKIPDTDAIIAGLKVTRKNGAEPPENPLD